MSTEIEGPEPQDLLPEILRQKWAVLPKTLLYQLFLVAALLGAGIALTTYGFICGNRGLLWAFPVAVLIAKLQNKLPWGKRATHELQEYLILKGS